MVDGINTRGGTSSKLVWMLSGKDFLTRLSLTYNSHKWTHTTRDLRKTQLFREQISVEIFLVMLYSRQV